jgi:vancomycin permeability regulator SanA
MKPSKKHIIKTCIITVFSILVLFTLSALFIFWHVSNVGSKSIYSKADVPKSDAIIVLGAYVFPNGQVSEMLADRLDTGIALFEAGKAPKIVVSGDHGHVTYDEVNAMRKYLQARGIKREDIFMDHAGFNTYDSLYRARDIFLIKKAIIVTQKFHLVRALYISKELGLEAYGVTSDNHVYPGILLNNIREIGSRMKAFLQAGVFKPKPKFLGKVIPITGDGSLTDDGKS